MIKKTIGAGLLSLALQGASAQPAVSIYGLADASVGVAKNGQSTIERIDSGVGSGSRLGILAGQDLGGGLRANATLEMGLAFNTGTSQQGGAPFGRQIFVGLSHGDAWNASLGRQYSPLLISMVGADATGQGFWGNTNGSGLGTLQGPTAVAGDAGQNATARISNSLQGSFTQGPFNARLMVAAGDQTANKSGQFVSPSFTYTQGPLMLTMSLSRFNQYAKDIPVGASPAPQSEKLVGATYDFKLVKLHLGYYDFNPSERNKTLAGGTITDARSLWAGIRVPLDTSELILQVMQTRYAMPGGNGTGVTYAAAYEYLLSTKTRLYLSYGLVENGARSKVPLFGATAVVSPSAPGADVSALAAGVIYSF